LPLLLEKWSMFIADRRLREKRVKAFKCVNDEPDLRLEFFLFSFFQRIPSKTMREVDMCCGESLTEGGIGCGVCGILKTRRSVST